MALVGPTGSGKSTFVKLIQRLYDIQDGRILIDGQDIALVSQESLRRAVAVVPQDPALFHRSIGENIGYARPDATLDEIVEAARQARAHDFIARLPDGYDTLVGERGIKLSGGERQRVAIARAFLADAPILVLDEATSSLDGETELLVQAATEALMAGRTTWSSPTACRPSAAQTAYWCSRMAGWSRRAGTATWSPVAGPMPGCTLPRRVRPSPKSDRKGARPRLATTMVG